VVRASCLRILGQREMSVASVNVVDPARRPRAASRWHAAYVAVCARFWGEPALRQPHKSQPTCYLIDGLIVFPLNDFPHSPVVPCRGFGYFLRMTRTGIGFDAHRLVAGRLLIIGGVEIPHDRGLLGHSDADVLVHAIMDALLGAIADGDIGQHFPPTDPCWKNASSIGMLRLVAARLQARGWQVVNVDSTVQAEAPRLAPHIPRMRTCIAEALGIDVARISVKATTTEGLGAVGRCEGITAMAVAAVLQADAS